MVCSTSSAYTMKGLGNVNNLFYSQLSALYTTSNIIIKYIFSPDDGGGEGLRNVGFCPELTRLFTREDFIEFSRRESFESYNFIKASGTRL
jgi:hypothetical protein